MSIEIFSADAERLNDIRQIFGTTGDPSWCKCQYFIDENWNQGADANDLALQTQVCTQQVPAGLVAYADGEPAGWVQVGPSTRYPRFKPRGHQAAHSIWALTCFVVRDGYRKRGVARELLRAAIGHARDAGAEFLRARPTDTEITAKDSAGLFTGVLSSFQAEGFEIVNRNHSMTLVQLRLAADPT